MTSLGRVESTSFSYPIMRIVLGKGKKGKVLISGGIHGDEPTGVEAICSFIEQKEYAEFMGKWEMTLIPCINPFGYDHDKRNNFDDIDLNRQFKSFVPPREVALVQSVFHSPFDLTLELHDDVDSTGYYFYHWGTSNFEPSLASKIREEVKKIMPINVHSDIDGTHANRGLIERQIDPEKRDWWPMALYARSKGTRYCLTLEAAPHFPMEICVKAHLSAIKTALKNFIPKR
jgi:protein MpaA